MYTKIVEGLKDYKPFTDPRKIPDESINKIIRNEANLLYVSKGGKVKRVLAKQFGQDREQAVRLTPYKHTETFSGRHIPDWKMSTARKKYATKLLKDSPKIKTYSKTTQKLYPSLSKDQKWFKRVEREWGKKKGRTPFDF